MYGKVQWHIRLLWEICFVKKWITLLKNNNNWAILMTALTTSLGVRNMSKPTVPCWYPVVFPFFFELIFWGWCIFSQNIYETYLSFEPSSYQKNVYVCCLACFFLIRYEARTGWAEITETNNMNPKYMYYIAGAEVSWFLKACLKTDHFTWKCLEYRSPIHCSSFDTLGAKIVRLKVS